MRTAGNLEPATAEEIHDIYDALAVPAKEIVHDITVALDFDRAEYNTRVDQRVITRARDALFGTLLRIQTDSRDSFESMLENQPYASYECIQEGSPNVDHIAWHVSPATETIVAASYQDHPEAAVATLRRIAWNELYTDILHAEAVATED